MKKQVVLYIVLAMHLRLLGASPLRDVLSILPHDMDVAMSIYPFSDQVKNFLGNQAATNDFKASGFSKTDYLKLIEKQVRAFYHYQDKETGAIIDPVYQIEWQYSTPCYALSIGLLAATGYINDEELLQSGIRALDCSVSEMHENRCAHHHGEFFIQPIMLAMDLYKNIVPSGQLQLWRNKISTVDPYLLYKDNLKRKAFCYNHNVVALAGEYLRQKENICSDAHFLEWHLEHQKQYMSANGLYIDNKTNPPMVYDEFTRQFITAILVEGYEGTCKAFYAEKLLHGAWTSLFMQSPYGEVPTGGRSAQHIWNEAAAAVTYEIYATQYAQKGMIQEAGAFKRAAHLALKSIARWQRPDGTGFIVKNRFPIEVMHGYESYSAQSQYNLLACWLMSVAYLYADDRILEQPAPCDTGGYVIALQDVFHKVFANANGNYIEYDYSADPRYNATGLIRIHLQASNPQLGPSDGVPHIWDNKKKKDLGGELMAVGPAWFDAYGKEHRLAEYTNISYPDTMHYSAYPHGALPEIEIRVKQQHINNVSFDITYKGNFGGLLEITQSVQIDKNGVTVRDCLRGNVKGVRVYYPMLVFDGTEESEIMQNKNQLMHSLRDGGILFEAIHPSGSVMRRTGNKLSYRNGFAEGAFFDASSNEVEYRISARPPH